MIHTVKIDDKTPTGKRLINELRKHRKIVEFENPTETGIVPEGYMTSEEFRIESRKDLDELCKKYAESGVIPEGYVTSEEFIGTVKENLRKKFTHDSNL